MRKSFTRLFSVFILFCMISLQVVAQSTSDFGYSLNPSDGKYPVARTGDFVITMNTAVKPVYNGTISLFNFNGTEYVPIQLRSNYETAAGSGIFNAPAGAEHPWRVTFSGNKVTINFGYTLGEFKNYYIEVNEFAISNAAGTVRFEGLQGNGPGSLTKGNDNPDWDFTTIDVTPPTPVWSANSANCPNTDPTDEEGSVATSKTTFCLKFNEGVKWASGYPGNLKVGDIALYESTDFGVYGGDVVFPTCTASIVGDRLEIIWPGASLPSLAKLYVRIKPGIITDEQDLPFAGFKTNGTGSGIGWNFTTQDGRVPAVAFAMTGCTSNSNFTITLDELGILVGTDRNPITNSNIKDFVTFSGGNFSTSVSTSGSNTIITVDPAAALTSGGTYTVGILAGLWDSGFNTIPAKTSSTFTAGDYTAPTTDIYTWKNPDGTSFNINLRVNNEPAGTNTTYYYIVVKASDVDITGTPNKYQTENLRTLFLAANSTAATDTVTLSPLKYKWRGASGTSDDKWITVYQQGDILAPQNTELLEHVVNLPASHGTDWVVYMFGADGSLCGSSSVAGVTSTKNVTAILNTIRPSTYDILEPEVNFTAALVDATNDTISGCDIKVGKTGPAEGIKRMGPVYINFNEAVENANGTPINGASIANAVTLTDGVVNYPINTATSSYDAANKRMIIYPTIPFGSSVTLTVTLGANTIQDEIDNPLFGPNGTELLTQKSFAFCVEAYDGPVVTISPCTATEELDRAGDIVIYVDQDLYAPAVDSEGQLLPLSNVTTDPNYVGKYVQVRKHGVYPSDPAPSTTLLRDAGTIIYQGDNPAYAYFLNQVTITVTYPTSGDGDSTIITISPINKTLDFWESETWYSLEIDQTLRSIDLLDLTVNTSGDPCTIDNYWGYFMAEDSREPLCIFYEDQLNLFANDGLGTVDDGTDDPLLDGNITVETNSNILVSIDEWIQLGFGGFVKQLETSDKIEDANALRRYFALYEVTGTPSSPIYTPISFDAKDFTLDAATDIAQFFIDPYYSTGDDPNWKKGKKYRVCYIDNPNEFEQYRNLPALTDDNLNGVTTACANFTCPADVVAPTCLVSAKLNGFDLYTSGSSTTNIPVTADSILTLTLCFDVPVDQPTGGDVAIRRGATTVQTANLLNGVRSGDYKCITYTFDMHAGSVLAGNEWMDNETYELIFSAEDLITNAIMGCSFPGDVDPFNDIHTIDGSAPYIVSFIPDLIGAAPSQVPGCLFDKDSTDIIIVWDETVVKQAGKKLEIWRDSIFGGTGQNALVLTLDASADTTVAGDATMRIPNLLFKDMLQYNTSYYIHIPAGFVKNVVGLGNAGVTTDDTLRFCVGPDPAPRIVCGGYSPAHLSYTPNTTPYLVLTFSEPVQPVAGTGKDVQVYRTGAVAYVTDSYLHAPASAFVPVPGKNNTQWRLNTATAFATAGVHPAFIWGEGYDVNVPAGAFKEVSGTQTNDTLITNTINGFYNQSACPWTFYIGDNVAPTITFWPANNKEHIATNSHLYAYISEFPIIDALGTETPLNVTNIEPYFSLTRGTGAVAVPFDVEYVGADIVGGDNQKQRIRVIPRDPMGQDWSLTSTTPSMMADSLYTLSFTNLASPFRLEDAAGNGVVNKSTTFRVEDIVCPTIDVAMTPTSSADSVWVSGSLNEAGKVRFVVKTGSADNASAVWGAGFNSLGLARGEVSTSGGSNNFAFKFGLNATQATGYSYKVYAYLQDDEVDLFDTDAEITAEWPYSDPDKGFETEVYRIKDLRPSPNWCNSNTSLDVTLCDNDKPLLVSASPAKKGISDATRVMNFPIAGTIVLGFNELVQINDGNTGNKIVLRDANNNLGVPLAYEMIGGGDSIRLYPLDSNLVANETEALQLYVAGTSPVANLKEETDYYLEIDRWAISDVDGCGTTVNYFGEWVGKDTLAFKTEDKTGPCLVDWTPETCVEPEADITLTFFERNVVSVNPNQSPADSAYVYIYRVGDIVPHERIPASWITGPVKLKPTSNPNDYTFTVPTAYMYLSKGTYRVRVPNNLFVDNSGNPDCGNGYDFTFDVRDYEDPIPSWTLIQDYTYLNVAYTDPEYQGRVTSGIAGATQSDVPTSSLLKVEFNEDVYLWDTTPSTDEWKRMDLMTSNDQKAIVAATITLTEKVGDVTTTLTYDKDGYGNATNIGNWEFTEIGSDYAIIRVYRAQDHWTPSLTSPFLVDAGMKSNATYTIALAPNKFADDEDCDEERNIFDGVNPLVTINTRDDVPPTLAITDASNAAVCGTMCVEAGPVIKLRFSGKVVKTPFAGIDYDNLGSPFFSGDVNWWSNSNLPLLPADLMQTETGDFLTFYATDATGSTVGDSVLLSGVTVDPNGQDITLTLDENLTSQGWYKIEFAGGSVKDQKRVPDGNEFIGMSCIFRVKDTVKPSATAFFPADDNDGVTTHISNVLGSSTLSGVSFGPDSMAVAFSEPIFKSNSDGKIIIRRTNGEVFDTISLSKTRVKNNVLVFKAKALEEFTGYYVEIPAGFVTDTTSCTRNGNVAIDPEIPFASGDRFAWNFSTADDTPPTPIVYIPNDTDTVPRNSNLTIIFDENIKAEYAECNSPSDGVYIYHHDNTVGWVGNPAVDFGNIVEFIPFWSTSTIANYALEGTDIYNGFDKNKIIFNPTNDFTRVGTYYIRVSGDCIKDGQNNFWTGLGDSTTWKFTVTNDVAPVLASTDPFYNHNTPATRWQYVELPADDHGFVTANLSMFFVDELYGQPLTVSPGTGKLKIMEYRYNSSTQLMVHQLWKEIDINDPSVFFNAQTGRVDITGVRLRDNINQRFGSDTYEECYYILADPGTVTNGYPGSQTFWGGIDNPFVWRFQTGADNVFVPGFDIISWNIVEHGNSAKDLTIAAASTLEVKFNEGIEALAAPAGKVQVFKVGVTAPVEEVTVLQSMVQADGVTLKVPLTALVDETNYYVQVQAGAFGDTSTVSTNNFAFGGADVWAFQTGDNTAPVAVTKTPNGTCVNASTTLTMTFNESRGVVKGSGNLEVVDGAGTVIAQVAAAAVLISQDGNIVTALVAGLPDTTLLTVNVPAGFLFDGDQHSPMPNAAFSWSFTTGENTVPTVAITPDVVTTADTALVLTFSESVTAVPGKFVTVGTRAVPVADFTTLNNIVYTLPLVGLTSEASYTVAVEAGAFIDVNANCTPNAIAATTETFTVGDLTPPLVTGSPKTASDYVGLVLNLNFTEAVTPATGAVKIYTKAGVLKETIAVNAPGKFTASAGNTVYTFKSDSVRYGEYYILIDAGAFVDNSAAPAGVPCPGISDPTAWTLSVVDPSFCDNFTIISPLRGTQNVPVATTVVIEFCEDRLVPGVGVVTIGDQSINRVLGVNYFEYPVTAAMISGKKLSIPVTGLRENTTYSIIIPQGAIKDEAGNSFIGITDANLWIFTTGDFTNPTVSVPTTTALNDGSAAPIAITSTEAGIVYLAKDDVAANAAALLAAIAQNKAVAATLTAPGSVNVSVEGLVVGTYKAYGFDASGRMGTATNLVTVTKIELPTLRTIAAIQGTGETSPFAGQILRTKGTVTATSTLGYYIQDANAAWSGIFVASTTPVSVGMHVEITGTAAEVSGITVINNVTKTDPIGPVLTTVTPVVVTGAVSESYESVIVRVKGRATAAATVTGDWTAGTYAINNALYGSYTTLKDYNYQIDGIVATTKILAIEIHNLSLENGKDDLSSAVKVYPNPFDKYITLEVSSNVVITKAVITNIAGQLVKEVINPNNTIATSELRSGVYFISLHTVDGIAKTERIIKR